MAKVKVANVNWVKEDKMQVRKLELMDPKKQGQESLSSALPLVSSHRTTLRGHAASGLL